MDWITPLSPYLPEEWLSALRRVDPRDAGAVQEIRLRRGEPLTLSLPRGEWFLTESGALTQVRQSRMPICDDRRLETCFLRFCDDSVYAHEEELRQGFIAVAGGIRVGVAGTAVTESGAVRSVRGVTSLCVRLPRRHAGCAASVLPFVTAGECLHSILLVGEPSSGKTSLLRDLALSLAKSHYRIAVVDERGELAGLDGLAGCDVLCGYPKPVGIRQAVRCLAPQAVIFDELGDDAEVEAILSCAHAGVAVIASMHGRDRTEIANLPSVRRLARAAVFEEWVFLAGRRAPGHWVDRQCPEVVGDAVVWHDARDRGGDRDREVLFPPLVSADRVVAAGGSLTAPPRTADSLYGEAADTALVRVGG